MDLANYIKDLLYRYDCVIVPDFGGFITNNIGAVVSKNHGFFPPRKQLGFNSNLTHNDGLLANYIASVENISFEKATNAISLSVIKWNKKLQSEKVVLENLGSLFLNNEKKIIFNPDDTINYLTSSFGLVSYESKIVSRIKEKPVIVPIEKNKKIPVFVKYAASAAVLFAIGFASFISLKNYNKHKTAVARKEAVEKQIQSATFFISNPLPTIKLSIEPKKIEKPYHIIAGAFQFEKNANKKVSELIQKGFNAKIIGKNKWGLTQVAIKSLENREDAEELLKIVKATVAKDAWILFR